MSLNSPQKSTGLINQTDTAKMILCYPLNDLNYSRVSGQPESMVKSAGAERVSGLFILINPPKTQEDERKR